VVIIIACTYIRATGGPIISFAGLLFVTTSLLTSLFSLPPSPPSFLSLPLGGSQNIEPPFPVRSLSIAVVSATRRPQPAVLARRTGRTCGAARPGGARALAQLIPALARLEQEADMLQHARRKEGEVAAPRVVVALPRTLPHVGDVDVIAENGGGGPAAVAAPAGGRRHHRRRHVSCVVVVSGNQVGCLNCQEHGSSDEHSLKKVLTYRCSLVCFF